MPISINEDGTIKSIGKHGNIIAFPIHSAMWVYFKNGSSLTYARYYTDDHPECPCRPYEFDYFILTLLDPPLSVSSPPTGDNTTHNEMNSRTWFISVAQVLKYGYFVSNISGHSDWSVPGYMIRLTGISAFKSSYTDTVANSNRYSIHFAIAANRATSLHPDLISCWNWMSSTGYLLFDLIGLKLV